MTTRSSVPLSSGQAERLVRARYAALRAAGVTAAEQASPLAVLSVGDDWTAIAAGTGAKPSGIIVMNIGSMRTAGEFFKRLPPSEADWEYAINAVEDEIVRAVPLIPADAALRSSDEGLREIARLSGVPGRGTLTLSRDDMERTFTRLSRVSQGSTAEIEGLPADGAFAARLLILREAMHHLGFESILIG